MEALSEFLYGAATAVFLGVNVFEWAEWRKVNKILSKRLESHEDIHYLVGEMILWCNEKNYEAIKLTERGKQPNIMLQAFTLDYDDFNTVYHYIYTATGE